MSRPDSFSSGTIAAIIIMLLFFAGGDPGNAESPSFKRAAKEQRVASLNPAVFVPESLAVSPDGKRVVYLEKIGDKTTVVVDGVRQKTYDEIVTPMFGLEFSPDSSKIGYFARENKDWFLVIDGREQREHALNIERYPVLGEVTYSRTGNIAYSEEGAHYCYVAEDVDRQYLVVDGKKAGNKYEEVFLCAFSRDGRRVAHAARERRGGKIFYVIDGVKQQEYGFASHFTFSPDGRRFAYLAYPTKSSTKRGQKKFVVLDGSEEKEHDNASSVLFSPDSKRTAYLHTPPAVIRKPVIILDGKEIGDERAGFSRPVFSPDSRRFAHMAGVAFARTLFTPNPPLPYEYNVIDGKPGKNYDGVSTPVFSPDSSRVAYYGRVEDAKTKKYIMVINNEEGKPYDHTGHPVFSPDSRRVGYQAAKGADHFIVVDGREYKKYEFVSNPVFSPDSRRVCYVAKKSEKRSVVIDNVEGQFYDAIYPKQWKRRVADTGIGFSSYDTFYYFARKGDELVFVQEKIIPHDEDAALPMR